MPPTEPTIAHILDGGDPAPNLDEKLRRAEYIRAASPDMARKLDTYLLGERERYRECVSELETNLNKLVSINRKLSALPWYPAVFVELVDGADGPRALVAMGSNRRVVSVHDDVDILELERGGEVLLNAEQNAVMARNDEQAVSRYGETAEFIRRLADGRVVLKWRVDEQLIAEAAASLDEIDLKEGDLVRFDSAVHMAYEKIERAARSDLFLEETPQETFESIGGLDGQIEKVKRTIWLHLHHPEIIRKYRIRRVGSVLLIGPPGTGKTMMAKALANWLRTLSASGRSRFINIKPSSLHSMWYAQSEANYREAFRIARKAGEEEPEVPIVMFFDEVDSVGSGRGESLMRVDDRVLTAFMAELDGLESRGNILVVAATNRPDALDPALLRHGRLGDLVVHVPRPNMRAARDILAKYLLPDLPYAENGHGADQGATREELIECAVAHMYSPNGDNLLATITFRDGKRRAVRASDLASGAILAGVARLAVERAGAREAETGEAGIRLDDLLSSIGDEFRGAAGALTPANCRRHLSDLPQDVDAVSVELAETSKRVTRPYQYLSVQ